MVMGIGWYGLPKKLWNLSWYRDYFVVCPLEMKTYFNGSLQNMRFYGLFLSWYILYIITNMVCVCLSVRLLLFFSFTSHVLGTVRTVILQCLSVRPSRSWNPYPKKNPYLFVSGLKKWGVCLFRDMGQGQGRGSLSDGQGQGPARAARAGAGQGSYFHYRTY